TGDVEGPVEHKVYTEADIDTKFDGLCAAVHLDAADIEPAQEDASEPREGGGTAAAGQLRVFELAVDADVEFFAAYGSEATAEIEATLNMVDGIFEAEIGLTIDLVSVNVWQSEPDPYTATNGSTLLGQLRSYWNEDNAGIARDAVHLFTGKDLDGSTVGIAYVSVVCNKSTAYAVSQDLASDVLMPLLVAHELGHNLGSGHDTTGSSPRYIMYPSLGFTNLDEFSAASKTSIGDYIDSVSCLALADDGSGSTDPIEPIEPTGGGGGGGGGGPVDPLLILAAGWALWARSRTRTRRPPAAERGGSGA
ncbi:MAG TPA: zinc-dependent metalloprotease, partial [Planctomycetota bacterium]|nr:zinc-dependent metalloprotease [Planctomycetota bacterium]